MGLAHPAKWQKLYCLWHGRWPTKHSQRFSNLLQYSKPCYQVDTLPRLCAKVNFPILLISVLQTMAFKVFVPLKPWFTLCQRVMPGSRLCYKSVSVFGWHRETIQGNLDVSLEVMMGFKEIETGDYRLRIFLGFSARFWEVVCFRQSACLPKNCSLV